MLKDSSGEVVTAIEKSYEMHEESNNFLTIAEQPNSLAQKYESVLHEVGSCGLFQVLTVVSMLCGFLSSSWYVYAWSLFERMPEDGFLC